MTKAAAQKKTTTAGLDAQHVLQNAAALQATSQFWVSTFGMGWRMAITVLIPLVGGVKIDERFNTSPSYTLAGFFIAVAGASVVVWNTVKEVNLQTAEVTPKHQAIPNHQSTSAHPVDNKKSPNKESDKA